MGIIIAFSVFGAGFAAAFSVSGHYFTQYPFLLGILYFLLLFAAGFLAAFLVFYLVQLFISLFLDGKKPAERQNPYCVWAMEQTAELICFFCGLRVHVSGEELIPRNERFLFVSNHRSNFDPIIVMNKLRANHIAFVSKPSNLKIPIVGRFVRQCCFLPIDRENARNAVTTINQAAEYIKNDVVSVGIYPEGTRSKSAEMRPFHAGSFKIAQKAGAPIVVAVMRDTEKAVNRFIVTTDVYLDILAVIPAEEICAAKSVELSERIRTMIGQHIETVNGTT
jgi:1-acyl-sn-glycerol-3-phosphate acyltransferase